MAKFTKAWGIDDISGFKVPYRRLKKQWDNLMAAPPDFDEKHPRLEPPVHKGTLVNRVPNPRPEVGLETNLVPPSTPSLSVWVGTPSVTVV